MRFCLVRPPTFVPTGTTYPYNLDCIATALKDHGHEVSLVDGELIAEEEISLRKSSGVLDQWLSGFLGNGKRRASMRLVDHIFSKQRNGRRYETIESFFANGETSLWSKIAEKIVSASPEAIGFSCYSSSMSSTLVLIKILREKYGVDAPVILGGPHPSAFPEETLQRIPGADYMVIGEGERTVVELAKALSSGDKSPGWVDGICYRANGALKRAKPRELIRDMDELTVPAFEFAGEAYKNYVILTSRGCPFDCHYCASKVVWSRRVRYRPPKSVAQEIINLKRKANVRFLRFGDDTYTLNKRHMKGVVESLGKAGIKDISYSIGSRIDTIDHEKLEILKELPIHMISFGVETGSQRMMSVVDKNVDVRTVTPTIKMVNDAGIYTLTYFILNHPGEALSDMRDTLSLMTDISEKCRLNINELNIGFPYPGTPWWDYCKDKGLLSLIDIYGQAHKYNHQQMPAVNMTQESMTTINNIKRQIDQSERAKLIKEGLKSILK